MYFHPCWWRIRSDQTEGSRNDHSEQAKTFTAKIKVVAGKKNEQFISHVFLEREDP